MEREQEGASERRGNLELAAAVEECLVLQRTLGDEAARHCLEAKQVPEHIILRVMACAAFRRHACNSKSPPGFGRPLSSFQERPAKRV